MQGDPVQRCYWVLSGTLQMASEWPMGATDVPTLNRDSPAVVPKNLGTGLGLLKTKAALDLLQPLHTPVFIRSAVKGFYL